LSACHCLAHTAVTFQQLAHTILHMLSTTWLQNDCPSTYASSPCAFLHD
jgi:hypothetical protein